MGTTENVARLDHSKSTTGLMTEKLEAHLLRIFRETPPPSPGTGGTTRFHVEDIVDQPGQLAGCNSTGQPCILIGAPTGGTIGAPIRLSSLEVMFSIPCQIVTKVSGDKTERLTAIVCTSPHQQVKDYFAYAGGILLRAIGDKPSNSVVAEAVRCLVELFQRLTRPSRQTVTGIIGELLFISVSASPKYAVQAWRSAVDDRYDFSIDNVRLEVKASRERTRQHYLSYEQCHPPVGTVGILASVFVESSGGGMSLADLIESIEVKLKGNIASILRFHEVIADTLGQTLVSALSERFDKQLAEQSLQYYEISDVPAIPGPLPKGVSQVRFRADVGYSQARSIADFSARSACAARLLPEK